ncbi:MAG: nucleotide exchange factor GrpE [Acidobacteriota bacterium]|nr:MAG: nucleotide exchange factor GrpE [Acidobacteriota bacterium]
MNGGTRDREGGIEILEIVGLEETDSESSPSCSPPLPERGEKHEAANDEAPRRKESEIQTMQEVVVRLSRSRAEGRLAGIRDILRELLPALDDLEMCVRRGLESDSLKEVVRLTLRQMWHVFREHELERIEEANIPFDPRVHEAAQVSPTESVEAGSVLDVIRVGYRLGGTLVRPALVRVAGEAETGVQASDSSETDQERTS